MRHSVILLIILVLLQAAVSCRRTNADVVTIASPESFTTFDTLTTEKSDAAAERVRNLMFNSLVRKNESFDYVGELAKDITASDDGTVITFALRENVKFHNGRNFTSTDVKYTFDELFKTKGNKSFAFYETNGKEKIPHISKIETPDDRTVVFTLSDAAFKTQLLSNLVAVPIIAEGTAGEQRDHPIGTGPFKLVSFDQSQNTVEMDAFADYWEGAPKVAKIRVKTVTDASALQAELQTGGVDIAPLPSNLPPDSLKALAETPNLKVEQFDGSNIQYIGLNTESPPLNNVKVRQAIGYSIDREKIIKELLSGQAKLAYSILPAESWAYTPGVMYGYDPEKAKLLLAEAGYKGEPIRFKFAAGNAAYSSYVQAMQSMMIDIGLNIQIETIDPTTLRDNLTKGQFQMSTGVWVGGNQDPIFLRDLFTSKKIPGPNVACCNRSRYSNTQVDELVGAAFMEPDRSKAKELYSKAWDIISRDLPLIPLWYPANMVVANKRIEGIKISPSGDWGFIKNISVAK